MIPTLFGCRDTDTDRFQVEGFCVRTFYTKVGMIGSADFGMDDDRATGSQVSLVEVQLPKRCLVELVISFKALREVVPMFGWHPLKPCLNYVTRLLEIVGSRSIEEVET
jgi:hypothetical protein